MLGGRKQRGGATIIGKGDVLEGTIHVHGTLHLDGEVRGTIESDGEVSLGPDGLVVGDLHATTVVLGGRVEGRVQARGHLHVRSTGAIEGDAHYASLQVDRGGVILGTTGSFAQHRAEAPEDASEDGGSSEDEGHVGGIARDPGLPQGSG